MQIMTPIKHGIEVSMKSWTDVLLFVPRLLNALSRFPRTKQLELERNMELEVLHNELRKEMLARIAKSHRSARPLGHTVFRSRTSVTEIEERKERVRLIKA